MPRRISLGIMLTFLLICLYGSGRPLVFGSDTPQWRNQTQTPSSIPQGRYVSLEAEGIDADNLYYAFLSTNETGGWKNETEYPLLWQQNWVCGFDNFGTATYKDGLLYAPAKGVELVFCINASNGDVIWYHDVRQCDGSPCIDGDVVYVGECCYPYGEPTPQPEAMALNRFTGEEIWNYTEPNDKEWVGSPLVNGDYVYYTTYGSGVYALNKTNGQPIWHRPELGTIVCSVALDNGVIFVSANSPPGQYALNATTGATVWQQNYGASWDTSPVVHEGMIIQGTYVPSLFTWSTCVLNEVNGQLIRRWEEKGSPSTPLVVDDEIFIPSYDHRMWAYNLSSGQEVWHTVPLHDGSLQDLSYCSPAASGGAIYYQSLNGTFYVINQTDGCVMWSQAIGHFGFGSVSLGDGCAYVVNDHSLNAFRIGPGSGDWTMFCGNQYHQSYSDSNVEYVRAPLTGLQYIKESNLWVPVRFLWVNKTITSDAIAWRIYFFDNLGNGNTTDTMIFYVHPPYHDVAVTDATALKTIVDSGFSMSARITVDNVGDATETFNVSIYLNSTFAAKQTVANLLCGLSRVLTIQWYMNDFVLGNYTLGVVADTVPDEKNASDNACDGGWVLVTIPGDVTGDFTVNMNDIVMVLDSFGSTMGSDGWHWHKPICILCPHSPNMDIDDNGAVNMGDIVTALDNFGKHYP